MTTVVQEYLFGEERNRQSKFKHHVIQYDLSEDTVVSFQGAPGSNSKPSRADWTAAREAMRVAESKENTRRRLMNKLRAKVESRARPQLKQHTN